MTSLRHNGDGTEDVFFGHFTGMPAVDAAELVRRWNAHNAMRDALEAICDLPADDQGQRTIPAGYLDQARTAIEQANK